MEAYSQIIAGAQGTEGTKRLAAQYGLIRIDIKKDGNGLMLWTGLMEDNSTNQDIQPVFISTQIYPDVLQVLSQPSFKGY